VTAHNTACCHNAADHGVKISPLHEPRMYNCYRNTLISGDAVRIISAGGFYINYQRVSKIDEVLTEAVHILPNNVTLIRVGKWLFLRYDSLLEL
jgi:hypothetical protein